MANFKYFCDRDDGQTLEFSRVRHVSGKEFLGWDAASGQWVKCTRVVEYKKFASRHACDSRCFNASGRVMKCECSCGGKNHGKGEFSSTEVAV